MRNCCRYVHRFTVKNACRHIGARFSDDIRIVDVAHGDEHHLISRRGNRGRHDASKRNVALAQSVFNTTDLQYSKGTTDLEDWLIAQNSLKEAQNNYDRILKQGQA